MFKPNQQTDELQNLLENKISHLYNHHKINSKHLNRLLNLIIESAKSYNECIYIINQMPTFLSKGNDKYPLAYGEFRFNCQTKKWDILIN